MNLWIMALVLNTYWCLAQVRAHGEVCDRGNQGDGSGNVVKDTMRARLGERHPHEHERSHEHDSGDGLDRTCQSV